MEHENELLNEIEVSASEEYFSRVDFIFNLIATMWYDCQDNLRFCRFHHRGIFCELSLIEVFSGKTDGDRLTEGLFYFAIVGCIFKIFQQNQYI
jgi:hypothetical protein